MSRWLLEFSPRIIIVQCHSIEARATNAVLSYSSLLVTWLTSFKLRSHSYKIKPAAIVDKIVEAAIDVLVPGRGAGESNWWEATVCNLRHWMSEILQQTHTNNAPLEWLVTGFGVTLDPLRETAIEYPKSLIYAQNYEIGIGNSLSFTTRWLWDILQVFWRRLWPWPLGANWGLYFRRGDEITNQTTHGLKIERGDGYTSNKSFLSCKRQKNAQRIVNLEHIRNNPLMKMAKC